MDGEEEVAVEAVNALLNRLTPILVEEPPQVCALLDEHLRSSESKIWVVVRQILGLEVEVKQLPLVLVRFQRHSVVQ